jgi:hypothetical protein
MFAHRADAVRIEKGTVTHREVGVKDGDACSISGRHALGF